MQSCVFNKTLGIPYVPFTFPTVKVKRYIIDTWGFLENEWSSSKVDNLYNWYKEAVLKEGLPAYMEGTGNKLKTIEYVSSKTELPFDEVQIFLDSLRDLVKAGEVDTVYLSIADPSTSLPGRVKAAAAALPNPADVVKSVKWLSFAAIAGLLLYFSWPYLKARKRIKRR